MAGWDERFASIMHETERSLARVKRIYQWRQKLKNSCSLGSVCLQFKLYHMQSQLCSPVAKRQAFSVTGSGEKSAVQQLPPPPGLQHHHNMDSPSLISLLSGRIQEQQKAISTLQDTVDLLQSTVQEQNQQIRTLRDEVALIQRLSEGQVELLTKQFKSEVSRKLELLRREHCCHANTPEVNTSLGSSLTAIAEELHSSKHMLNEEIDSLQRDLTLMRSRQVNQESEVTTWSSIIKDVERRQERLAKALSSLQDWQRTECQENDHLVGSNHKSQMSHLLAAIDHRITSLEQTLLQACTKNHGGSDTLTCRNPLHPDTTTRARKKTSISDTSLHLSLDASHDVSSDSDGKLSVGMLLDESSSISSLDSSA